MNEIKEIIKKVESIEGWLSDEVCELLIILASQQTLPIVEIGSWKGKSTIAMALASKAKVISIDPFTGSQEHEHLEKGRVDTYSEFMANCQKFGVESQIEVFRMTSQEAASQYSEKTGMIFVDGSHEYEDVKQDFELWFPKLAEGGVILFHDSKWQGVKGVLWESVISHLELGAIYRIEDTTFARKQTPSEKALKQKQSYLKLQKDIHNLKRLKRKLNKVSARLELGFNLE